MTNQLLCERVADAIAQGKVVGWFQGAWSSVHGRSGREASSGTPRNPAMQTIINMKVKFREGFRPFAPAVLKERARRLL
jgi:carbamoyltransferase